ncbi:putative Protein arginine N-methyltransferase 8 [Hypsibius exemplaris]|uniref:type I protein arginine methyltransferase n=1 Tax=Hypsibius exemplaris TaxID=2072580 RepID=A0A9X6RL47_HYPEX|nr:putative Protein arginine N-methyltransferase 8 [Hypsibius exemplaris]
MSETAVGLITTAKDRKFRPKFTLDTRKTSKAIQTAQFKDRIDMVGIIGLDKHQPSHVWYYKCYERLDIHRTMINDTIRTGSYLSAIGLNPSIFKDKIVLDVGTGTGVLSIFAVKEGGAKKVFAVDASAIAKGAELLVKSCGLEDRIKVVRDKIEAIKVLPDDVKKVDVIVSEWMGYALFNESVLGTVITARQQFLRDGGFMLPDMMKLRMVGSSCTRERPFDAKVVDAEENIGAADSVDLSFLSAAGDCFALNTLLVPNQLLTNGAVVKVVDMYTIQHDEVYVDSEFALTCDGHGIFRSFVLFFDVLFNLPHSWKFSTSPESPPTHWQQTVCCLPPGEEFEVWRDTAINGRIRMNCIGELPRFWTVTIQWTVTWKKKSAAPRTRTFYLM